MPYISEKERIEVERTGPSNAGQLNFAITKLIRDYFERQGGRYQQINDCIGALEGAKLEFYRRIAADYEDKKREENGDVY